MTTTTAAERAPREPGEMERRAMERALALAASPGVPLGPNPRVGCVILDEHGDEVAEGFHRGAGSPHAEVVALQEAGDAAKGATVVVTLEPCNHTGRTGPCAGALIAAGVRRVVFAQADTNPVAAGGAQALREAGVEVEGGLLADRARALNRAWTFAVDHGRPFVTWKFATTLDGRSAAADGTSRWVSSRAARLDTHHLRSLCDTMLIGTGTVAIDDPELTVRDEVDEPLPRQPLRAVMGLRDLDPGRRVLNDRAETVHLRTRDPHEALAELYARDRQHVFLEGGPTLAAAFLQAGLVDEIVTYVAPMLLGSGLATIGDLGITTIADALRPTVTDVTVLPGHDGDQPNVRLTMTPRPSVEEGGERPTPSVEEGAQRRPPSVEEGAQRRPPSVEEGAKRRPPSVEEGGERPTPSVEEGAQRRPPSVEEGAKRPSRDPGTREEA